MTIELAAIEPVSKPVRFGGTPLQQFARAGLALTIVDFRKMCEELAHNILISETETLTAHEITDIVYDWLNQTSNT